jgi:hypothetical protein
MPMRKLADPILNDLLLMLQARRYNDLTPTAVSRYARHLDRLDKELAEQRGGRPAPAFDDDVLMIRASEHRRLVALAAQAELLERAADAKTAAVTDIERFADVLLTEFADVLPGGATALDCALALLRAWRPDEGADLADDRPDDDDDTEGGGPPPSARGQQTSARGRGKATTTPKAGSR